jgi:HSP20 family molecular chaperone IbpA
VRDKKLLTVDVSYSVRTETESSYNEQSGSFCRTFPLPAGCTKDDVNATLEGDKLVIRIKQQ